MTITDEGRTAYGCNPRVRCSGTQNAWTKGCRHPDAVRAHELWKARKRAEREAAAGWPEGQCLAASHNTRYAAEVNGCRCPEALLKLERAVNRQSNRKMMLRQRDYTAETWKERCRVLRLTGGRLDADPRWKWRYGKAAVSSITVQMLLHGFPDNPNRAERMVAVLRLAGQQVRDEKTARMRPIGDAEIADRLGTSDATIKRLRVLPAALAAQRAARRLADVRWKAAVVAAAIERGRARA